MSDSNILSAIETPVRRRRRTGAVTLHEVARVAGVAPMTVSRALNQPDAVSQQVREKVAQAVADTGYVPNLLAGALASSRSRLVAMVVPTIVGPVFQETVQALTDALDAAGYQVMLGQSGYQDSREDVLLEAIIRRRPDAIVLTGIMRSESAKARLAASGIPVVETWDLTDKPVDMLVGFSHEAIGHAIAHYFYGQGRRHIAVVGGNDVRSMRRANALRDAFTALSASDALNEVSVPAIITVEAPATLGDGRRVLAKLCDDRQRVDAIFCSSDLLALGVLTEAQARGIKVPQQLSVIGFGDLAFAKDLSPALSTVRVDGTQIGQLAAKLIVDRLQGGQQQPSIHDIGFTLITREST
jgi:LacI family gluconate utilization system Gnt-I transcriptional repressor